MKNAVLNCLGIVALLGVVAGLVTAGPVARLLANTRPAPACEVGQWPESRLGFGVLRSALGEAMMGQSVECEHVLDTVGDTEQQTTTGLAHYDQATNTPSFVTSGTHWALTPAGLVRWDGADSGWDVPVGAEVVASPGLAAVSAAATANARPGILARATQVPPGTAADTGIARVTTSLGGAHSAGSSIQGR